MTIEELRRKRRDRTPVVWAGMAYGVVHRVARDGSWADMEWASTLSDLIARRTWRKRQPLVRLSEWVEVSRP